MLEWKTTLNYSENGIDYEQTFTAPYLPQKGDLVVAVFKDINASAIDLCFLVDFITFSNMTQSIRVNLKKFI